ncbi:recombinase RecT [Pantoea vagans]|uniref:RecT family recombinase n=1 Tax=Pantoea vagans TaxID=470934 RepID=UPI00225356D1|nr:RecT family recombinase [Pantoea vagans]MCX3308257.1 recombinase RecT [Pantoea vagans]
MKNQMVNTVSHPADTTATIFSPDALDKLVRFAEIMASSRVTVPAHLAGKPADCLAVSMQAMQWQMNPFAVAQKTFTVNGVLGYEAQLVNAVITTMAPTKDRLHYEWFGPWENVIGKFAEKTSPKGHKFIAPDWTLQDEAGCGVRVRATMKNEQEPRELELMLSQAQVRNSTLWASDPRQQLAYLAVKRWARLHCPDVILGVYTPDEIETSSPAERDVTPQAQSDLNAFISQSVCINSGDMPQKDTTADAESQEENKAMTSVPAPPPAFPGKVPHQPEPFPEPVPQRCPGKTQEHAENRKRSSEELLADFCDAALRSKSVSELARCYAYASRVLKPAPSLLDKATDVFLVRKAEIEEESRH